MLVLHLTHEELEEARSGDPNLPEQAARELFKYGGIRDGYWTDAKLMKGMKIAEFKYPGSIHTLGVVVLSEQLSSTLYSRSCKP